MSVQRVAVVGGSGATGREVVRHALRAELDVVSIDRSHPEPGARTDGVSYRGVDVLNGELASAFAGCDAVISTLGVAFSPANALSPPPLYTEGTRRILDGMEHAGIDRIVVISAAFVVDQPALPAWFKLTAVPALRNILEQMTEMEALLEGRPELRWTAVRPGWLIDKPAAGDLLVQEEILPDQAFRCRIGDLAAFLVECARNDLHVHAKPAVGTPEADKFESPLALGKEFAGL
ncbi:NAD(P)-dependent oxidoreductase [Porphyrobacter sp. GA68]|uniref:NAD(P)-dependent oxidoreductase n=1 Tax=Porphyrobacter sp. GA68 TaxID=2883480 RepID=UPI001D181F24|nr:NAD(P)H-binding protein [Porphyrobacter sp. GA68]